MMAVFIMCLCCLTNILFFFSLALHLFWLTVIIGSLQGYELTLRVLYRLFGEAEVEHDFFSSTTATSVYEMFLLTVVCSLYTYRVH